MLLAVALLLTGLPFGLLIANLVQYRRPQAAPGRPSLSVLIPARDEEANIGAACAAVLESTGVDVELIVLDDHSTDRTASILVAIADPRLRVVHAPPLPPGWSGKQHACARLAEHARHPLLIFVDADVRLAPDALSCMASFMAARPAVGLASGVPHQILRSWSEALALPMIHFLLLSYLPIARMRRSVAPSLGAGCGQLFIARAEAYARAGGHAAIHASRHDGLMLPRAFRRAGIMTDLFDADRLAAVRMYDGFPPLWEGLTKNATEGIARPISLPIWTAILAGGHLLPWAVLLSGSWTGALWAGVSILGRVMLAVRFRQPLWSALAHPLGVLFLLAVQWTALLRVVRGRPSTWRGRSYPS